MAPPPIQLGPPLPPFSASTQHHLQLLQNPITSTDNNINNTNIGGGGDGSAVVQFPGSGGGSGGSSSSPQTTTPTLNKKGRGRPRGSKNKPKPQTFVAVDGVDLLHSHIMELSPGSDIPATLFDYARRRLRGVSILNATGTVLNPSFCNLTPPHGEVRGVLPIAGTFEIVSCSGTILPSTSNPTSFLTVYLAGTNGQIIGGTVAGPLVAAGTVTIVAVSFCNASYEKLPQEIEEEDEGGGSANSGMDLRNMGDRSGSGGRGIQQQEEEEQLIGQDGFGWKAAHQHHHRQQQQQHQQLQSIVAAHVRPLYM